MVSDGSGSDGRRSEVVERLHDQLQDSLRALVTSDDWQQALRVASQFHEYSFANTRLIWAQAAARGIKPTRVAGYRAWQKLGRHVRRGEKGIQILAPVTRTVETDTGDDEKRVVGFRAVYVFDHSQTDGKPLPEVRPTVLEGDLPVHWETVAELIRSADFTLNVADIDSLGDAFGITDWRDSTVAVREGLPGAQRFKTALHELAHIRLHEPTSGSRPDCRGIIEVEAESVAYMVCAALGIDSAGYSLPYVATWSDGDLRKVSETADRVIRCARQVITELDVDRRLERDTSVVQTTSRERPTGRSVDIASPPARTASDELDEALHAAISYYQGELNRDRQAQAFLTERGFTQESADRWRVGYAPDSWDSLVNALRSQGLTDQALLEAGLAGRARTGRVYNRMRGRIIFPVHDAHGSPRGLAGRLISGDGPKYLNSPETVLYKKSELLYGLHHAATPIANHDKAVVVEGYTDAIAAHQAGITNTVATGGTALTDRQLEHLKRTTSSITLAFDGDEAGQQAAERVAEFPAETLRGLNLQVACLPDGTDPAGLICSGQTDEFRAILGNNKPLVHHLVDRTLGRYNLSEVEAPVRALYAATPLINHLTDTSDRSEVIAYIAKHLNQDIEHIERSLNEYTRIRTRQRTRRNALTRALR